MERRAFIQGVTSSLAAAALPRWPIIPHLAPRANILLIVADDLGFGDLGVTGRRDYRTPVLDHLAQQGTLLTQAYSSAPVCTPSRVALMTGRYPARYSVGLCEPLTTENLGLEPRPATLPRLLKNAGYETALVGKWHLGVLPQFHPLRHGFDEFYGILGAGADYASHYDLVTPGVSYFQDGERTVHTRGYLTDLLTERAVRIVSRNRRKPFFLSLQYNAPHWPWQGPGDPPHPKTQDMRAGGSRDTYERMVLSLDQGVGRVLEALQRRGLDQDTLVVFTSDNGGERFSQMDPFSQGKMTLWEGGIRVAGMARWPGVIPSGTRCDQVCTTFDLPPTAAAIAGTVPETSAAFDGIDLLPALRGGKPEPRNLFWRVTQREQQEALRSGDWKYLVTKADGEHLFDLAKDPGEHRDLKAEHREVLLKLRGMYEQWGAKMLQPLPLARD